MSVLMFLSSVLQPHQELRLVTPIINAELRNQLKLCVDVGHVQAMSTGMSARNLIHFCEFICDTVLKGRVMLRVGNRDDRSAGV